MFDTDEKIESESNTSPGRTERMSRAKYITMRDAFLPTLSTGLKSPVVFEWKVA
ncbi:hypothetical protein [Roseovarius sp. Pro17]|uniref:hypothetical protein n=1 Tax=Roseovarius sp. Pro17 TaxID=3108175 RepID=UPI002D7A3E69|nr:hypothetical protein [Roseovarius sp. Pro17]